MSRMGDYRIELQETADYVDGWRDAEDGVWDTSAREGKAAQAYKLGHDDFHAQFQNDDG